METVVSTDPDVTFRREAIHDLRNLFGIVASAKHILERDPARAQRIALLEALEDAATRGGELTSGLLANGAPARAVAGVDVADRIAGLRPMALALAGARIELDFEVAPGAMPVRMTAADFDAAILELVANAGAAEASIIVLRVRRVGGRIWIMVADDGPGMTRRLLDRARHGGFAAGAHGTGLARVRHFVRSTHGQFLVRSRPGGGTTIALILPMVLKLTNGEDGAPFRRHDPKHEEKTHEDRQPVAA